MAVSVAVGVKVNVGEGPGVKVDVDVAVGEGVQVQVGVGVSDGVAVAVNVGVDEGVGVELGVDVSVGVTVGVAPSAERAASIWMRGLLTLPPVRMSSTVTPVNSRAARTSLTLALGSLDFIRAQAPATCGAAIDVPFQVSYPPPGTDDVMVDPGAKSDRNGATFE
jgi:hypothetical protein